MLHVQNSTRAAAPRDAVDLARLINHAGEGLPSWLWSQMAEPGEDPFDVGRKRAMRDAGSFSYTNAYVCEVDRTVAGALITYQIGDVPEQINADMPPPLVPLQELENEALGSQYVNVLAVYSQYWGQGVGSRLLELAEDLCAGRRLSVIVSDGNQRARALYARHGYGDRASRPIISAPEWTPEGENWVLMLK